MVFNIWLQLIEEKYSAKQILALARSPFLPLLSEKDIHERAINFFEKDIVLSFNFRNGLNLFRNSLEQSQDKRDTKNSHIFIYLNQFIDKLESSSQGLAKLHKLKSIPLHCFIEELLNGLKAFGIYTVLREDDAGQQILDLLERQISHFKKIENTMDWSDAVGNGLRCLVLDIWAEGIIEATKGTNTIVLHDWDYFINREFYNTFKDEYFSTEGLDQWELFKSVKNWYEHIDELSQDSVLEK